MNSILYQTQRYENRVSKKAHHIVLPQVLNDCRNLYSCCSSCSRECFIYTFKSNAKLIAGWMPTRHLIDVVLGLDSLFTDLIDFDDALNAQAAQQWSTNRVKI